MYQLPPALAAVLATGRYLARTRLVWKSIEGVVLRTWELDDQRVIDGSVDADLARDARRSATMRLANGDGALSPSELEDPFAEGSWLAVERGADLDGGSAMVPLINGFVTACRTTMDGVLSLTIESFLSAAAQPAGFAQVLGAGTYIGAALRRLLEPVLPHASWVIDDADRALGSDIPVLPGDDRLQLAMTIARDSGLELLDDRLGRIVVRPRPDPTTQAVARAFPFPITLEREVRRRPYNAQPLEGTPGTGEPFWVVAMVDDQTSPIHPDRIGLRMAPVIRSDSVADPDTAMAAARASLERLALSQEAVTSTEVPILDIDEGDIGEWSEAITGTVGRYRIDRISIPIVLGTTSIRATHVVPLWAA